MLRMLMGALLLTLAFTHTSAVNAGPNDTPLSTFSDAQAALHVYTAVGAIKNNKMETIFICTNLHTSPVHIGVEFFDKAGTPINSITDGNGELRDIGVGATVTIGSGSTNVFTEDAILLGLPNFPPIPSLKNGSARVVATFFLGWAMQHYYLDAKIWRVRRDPSVEKHIY